MRKGSDILDILRGWARTSRRVLCSVNIVSVCPTSLLEELKTKIPVVNSESLFCLENLLDY